MRVLRLGTQKKNQWTWYHENGVRIPMQKDRDGYFRVIRNDILPGTRYLFSPDGDEAVPDPASHFQPNRSTRPPPRVVNHAAFSWTDTSWAGIPLKELTFYEIQTVGTFTLEGTFEGIIPRLG